MINWIREIILLYYIGIHQLKFKFELILSCRSFCLIAFITSKSSHNYFDILLSSPTTEPSHAFQALFPSLPENSLSHWSQSRSSLPVCHLSPPELIFSTCSQSSSWLVSMNSFWISRGMLSKCRFSSVLTLLLMYLLASQTSVMRMFPPSEWHTSIYIRIVLSSICLPKCLLNISLFCNLCREYESYYS